MRAAFQEDAAVRLKIGAQAISSGAYVLGPGDGRVLDMGPFWMTMKAASSQTYVAWTLLEADEPPGFVPPMHVHDDAGEAFYVLAGEYIVLSVARNTDALPGRLSGCPQALSTDLGSANRRAGSSTSTFLPRWRDTSKLWTKPRPPAQ